MSADLVRLVETAGAIWALAPFSLAELTRWRDALAWSDSPPVPPSLRARQAPPGTLSLAAARGARTAIVGLYGVLSHRPGLLQRALGGTDLLSFVSAINGAVADPSIRRIVLDIDSPGGTVAGVPEAAEAIRRAAQVKPVVAVANTLAASAAYWLASQASELVVAPSGQVGSIGVVAVHQDRSARLAMDGIDVTLVVAGKHKAEGNPFGPLNQGARARAQAKVDEIHSDFLADVAKGRRVSTLKAARDFGEGRLLDARYARLVGMADRIATLDVVVLGA